MQTPAEARQAETQENARRLFLEALRGGKSVSGAARYADVGRATVYRWRDEDEAFAAAWDDAYETGTDAIEEEAVRRATKGVEKPLFYKGQPIMVDGKPVVLREYSDTLLMQQLNARRPEKYRTNHKIEHTGALRLSFDRDDGEL